MRKVSLGALIMAMSVSPTAHALEFEPSEDTKVSIFGDFEPSIVSRTNANGNDRVDFVDQGSTLGARAEHKINETFTVFGQFEFEFFIDDSNNTVDFDEGYLGAQGPWGTAQAGGQENPYTYLIKDNVNIAEIAEISGGAIPQENNMAVYHSPTYQGFSVSTKVRMEGDGDPDPGPSGTAFGTVASFEREHFGVHAGVTTLDGGTDGAPNVNTEGETYGITADVSYGPAMVAAKYEQTDGNANVRDASFGALTGSVSYGPGKFYTSVQQVDRDSANDSTEFTVGADYKPIESLKLYTEAGFFDRNNDQGDVVALGAIYEF